MSHKELYHYNRLQLRLARLAVRQLSGQSIEDWLVMNAAEIRALYNQKRRVSWTIAR